jgi:hypothetical protein
MKPRHFVQLETSADIREAFGPLSIKPCDAPPAYWQRTPSGDLALASQATTEALHCHIRPAKASAASAAQNPV